MQQLHYKTTSRVRNYLKGMRSNLSNLSSSNEKLTTQLLL